MKRMSFIFKRLYIIIFLVIIFCGGCNREEDNFIYKSGRKWIFNAYFYDKDKNLTDTIEMKMQSKRFNSLSIISGQKGLNFEYSEIKEKTGLTEDEKGISLHSPRQGVFVFTIIVPMPSVTLPPCNISESTIELNTLKTGIKELDKQIIYQATQQKNETEEFYYKGNQLLCYKIEGWNTSHIEEIGQYKVTYFFNEHFGFVRFLYEKPEVVLLICD